MTGYVAMRDPVWQDRVLTKEKDPSKDYSLESCLLVTQKGARGGGRHTHGEVVMQCTASAGGLRGMGYRVSKNSGAMPGFAEIY